MQPAPRNRPAAATAAIERLPAAPRTRHPTCGRGRHPARRRAPVWWLLLMAAGTVAAAEDRLPFRPLVVRGLWHRDYRIEEAIAHAGGGVPADAWAWDGCGSGWPGPGDQGGGGIGGFPPEPELARYAVVVLCNVNAAALAPHLRGLCEHVRAGGGLLVLGGRFALGRQVRESALGELLPVTCPGEGRWLSDLVATPGGVAVTPGPDAGLLAGAAELTGTRLDWHHRVQAKPGSQVLLQAGDAPILVRGTAGKGRVAVFAGTVMGDPDAGASPLHLHAAWPRVAGELLRWLAEPAADPGSLPEALRAGLHASGADTGLDDLLDEAPDPQRPAGSAVWEGLLAQALRRPLDRAARTELATAAAALDGDLTPTGAQGLADLFRGRDPTLAATAQQLFDSGLPWKSMLAAKLLGLADAPNAAAQLQALYAAGEPAAWGRDGGLGGGGGAVGGRPVLPADQERVAFALRLACLEGLGWVSLPAARTFLTQCSLALAESGAPRPRDYADTLTWANRLYQAALLARLQQADASAAQPLVEALMENTYVLMRARTEGNKPKDRIKAAHEAMAQGHAWQTHQLLALADLPDQVGPALARAIASVADRRAEVLALAAFARPLTRETAEILAASPSPVCRALAATRNSGGGAKPPE